MRPCRQKPHFNVRNNMRPYLWLDRDSHRGDEGLGKLFQWSVFWRARTTKQLTQFRAPYSSPNGEEKQTHGRTIWQQIAWRRSQQDLVMVSIDDATHEKGIFICEKYRAHNVKSISTEEKRAQPGTGQGPMLCVPGSDDDLSFTVIGRLCEASAAFWLVLRQYSLELMLEKRYRHTQRNDPRRSHEAGRLRSECPEQLDLICGGKNDGNFARGAFYEMRKSRKQRAEPNRRTERGAGPAFQDKNELSNVRDWLREQHTRATYTKGEGGADQQKAESKNCFAFL